jgi:predicted metalloprotease with PDZ domain
LAATARIRYTVSMDDPGTHYFRVVIGVQGFREKLGDADYLRLVMPVWAPGSYLVREFARNVLDVSARDSDGRKLETQKESKNVWTVRLDGASEVTVDYAVYAFAHTSQQSYLDSDHAVINGSSVFLFVQGLEAEGLTLEVVPHPSWGVVSTGLERLPGGASHEFLAASYDVLIDSPIEVGNQTVRSFDVMGVRHEVSIFSPLELGREREDAFVSDLERIVRSEVPVFEEIPYARYVFLVNFGETARGGTEHLNSTLCIISYFSLEPPQEYRKMLGLFSHEFFHLWNVKRMRPVGLGPFEYSAETYTKSLWVAEGLTSYYDDIFLRRAGIFSVPEYLDALCSSINVVRSLPSSRWRSPQEASFNTWTNFYRPDENSPNVSPSYYLQGTVVGLALDLQIRKSTSNERSLDDAMRKVYTETYLKAGSGYTELEFERACEAVGGEGVSGIFEKHVRGREPVDVPLHLGYAGLTLVPRSNPGGQREGFLGVRVSGGGDRLTVVSRLFGSPAEKCDLSAGDEVLAVDGLRVDGAKLAFSVAVAGPGSAVKILCAREGVLREVTAQLAERPVMEFRVQKKESASPEEKALFRSWMLESWDAPIQYSEYRASPVARRQPDYI